MQLAPDLHSKKRRGLPPELFICELHLHLLYQPREGQLAD
jgi:hypothetical protein